jgi:hypothetical protein
MTLEDFVHFAERRVAYKPDTEIVVDRVNNDFLIVNLVKTVPDSNDPTQVIRVSFQKAAVRPEIEMIGDEAWARRWFGAFLIESEMHEIDEWFRVDSVRVRESHHPEAKGRG